jgi:putative ABC transport system permease protein
MNILRMVRLAWNNLLTQKRRSFLTMLGIIIGIFAVVLVMSTGAGAQSIIVGQIAKRGTDQIAILPGASDEKGPPASALGIVITTLNWKDAEALLDTHNVSHINSVAGYVSGNDILAWQSEDRSVTYTGTTAEYKEMESVTMDAGIFFDKVQEKTGEHVMVLGKEIATEIFGNQEPVGQQVKLKKMRFRVIGVMAPQGAGPFEDIDNAVVIPLSVAQKELLGIRHVNFLRARVSDEQYIDQSIEEIKQTLIERHEEEDFSIRTISDALAMIGTITDAIRFFLAAVAAVSLFVGGVGVMNIMLISVREKTREIGLRKAVGAYESDIRLQFLIETMLLTFVGTFVGFMFGVFVSYLIALVVQSLGYDYIFSISLPTVGLAVILALLIGLLFGFIPARRASKLDPIDALRYE